MPQNIETITITPSDSRWVGAWWLGYLIAGVITLLSAIPFWFLPRSLPVPGPEVPEKCTPEQTSFIKGSPLLKHKYSADEHTSFIEMAKGKEVYRLLGVMFLYMSYVENNVSQSTLYLGLTLHNLAVITHFLCDKVSTSHILDEELLIHHIAKTIHSPIQITEFRCSSYFHGHKCITNPDTQTASTSICESMGRSQELREFQCAAVIRCHQGMTATQPLRGTPYKITE